MKQIYNPGGHRLFATVSFSPASVLIGSVLCTLIGWFALWQALFVPTFVALPISATLSFGLPYLLLNLASGKTETKFGEQLPDAINLVSRGLQAGHPVPVALELVGTEMNPPISIEFANAIEKVNFGQDRNDALRDISKRYKNPDFMFFLSAIEMQRESGGNLVEVLDNLVRIIRERTNMRKKAFAVSAEGRLTALIVGALPYILGAFLVASNPTLFTDAMENELFWPLMFGAWVLWLFGIIWIWRMVNIKV